MADLQEVNDGNFEAEVEKSELPVLVDFFAEWCVPCQRLAPAVQAAAQELEGRARVVKCDVDRSQQTAIKYGVMGIPVLILFQGGRPVTQLNGAGHDKKRIVQQVERHLA